METLLYKRNCSICVVILFFILIRQISFGQISDTVDRDTADSELQEVVVPTLYGFQNRLLSTGSMATVGYDYLRKVPTTNLSDALYGRLPGLTMLQGSGELGNNSPAASYIRGKGTYNNTGYVVIVDGFESSYEDMLYEEIESVSVLKDAAALAMFGIKGANGAIIVSTKRGKQGPAKISFNVRTGVQQLTRKPQFVNGLQYATLYNEALHNDNLPSRYDLEQISTSTDNFLNPSVNWIDEIFRSSAFRSDYTVSASGGSKNARYYVALGYMNTDGLYAGTDTDRKLNSNLNSKRYYLRTNIDVNLNPIFSLQMNVSGKVENINAPNITGTELWDIITRTPSNAFPVKNLNGSWGGNSTYRTNPKASLLARGANTNHERDFNAIFRLNQNLTSLIKGLTLFEVVSFDNDHTGYYRKVKDYATQEIIGKIQDGQYAYLKLGTDTDYDIEQGNNAQQNRTNIRVGAEYNSSFGNHSISSVLFYHQDVYSVSGNTDPYAYQNIAGKVNYNYGHKYIGELAFSYSGSGNYASGKRFGFFPALSGAWIISNESFMTESSHINLLKVRASVGLTGNDLPIGDRYAYVQKYQYPNAYALGENNDQLNWNLIEGVLANPDLTWEKSVKYNAGIDAELFQNRLQISLDLFKDNRFDILANSSSTVPEYSGFIAPYINVGKARNHGGEFSATYKSNIAKFKYWINASVWYAKNKILESNEMVRSEGYLYRTGRPIGQPFGMEATGFYTQDDFDASGGLKVGLPRTEFTPPQPGDIKYKDQNNDNLINEDDERSIGKPFEPQLTFSSTIGAGYKGFQLEVFIHGIAERSVFLTGSNYWALDNQNNISAIALTRWTTDNATNASYPRLTTLSNTNNWRNSTFWMRSGSALRIRNIEFSYTFPNTITRKLHISDLKIHAIAVNPLMWDKIDTLDPEQMGGYPPLKSYNLGLSLSF